MDNHMEITGTTVKNDLLLQFLRKALLNTRKSIKLRVEEIQKNCDHDFEKVIEDGVLTQKVCTKCGMCQVKPDGQPWKVCTKCWGEMKYQGKTPGQGGDGLHIHECEDCGHEDSHT